MTDRPLRVALWLAVSTPEQAQVEKDSLRAQERDGRAWAGGMDADVVAVLSVPGHSRTYLEFIEAETEIPTYAELRQLCADRAFDVLWCRNRDRLGRSLALIATVDGLVQQAGAEVYSAAMPHAIGQQSSRSTTLLAAVEGWAAQAENAERTHRMQMGMAGRVRRGMLPNNPPTGYKPIYDSQGDITGYQFNGSLSALREITRLFLGGHSYREMVRRMTDSSHPAPGGGFWYYGTIRKICLSDVYAGYPSWGRVQYEGEEPSPFYPPLWDSETYTAILRERRRRKAGPYHRRGSGPYNGVAFCGRCGVRMFRTITSRPYYRCRTHMSRTVPYGQTCHANYTREEAITAAIAGFLRDLSSPELIEAALDEWTDDDQRERLNQERAEAESRLADLKRQRERLALALAAGDLDGAMYRAADDRLLEQAAAVNSRLIDVERTIDSIPDREYQRHILERLAKLFPHLIQHADPAEVAKLLQDAQFRVSCEEGRVVSVERGDN